MVFRRDLLVYVWQVIDDFWGPVKESVLVITLSLIRSKSLNSSFKDCDREQRHATLPKIILLLS